MTPRQLKLGSLPRCLLSRWELRSFCGIRGALTLGIEGYHDGVALQKAGSEPDDDLSEVWRVKIDNSRWDEVNALPRALLNDAIPVKFPFRMPA